MVRMHTRNENKGNPKIQKFQNVITQKLCFFAGFKLKK